MGTANTGEKERELGRASFLFDFEFFVLLETVER